MASVEPLGHYTPVRCNICNIGDHPPIPKPALRLTLTQTSDFAIYLGIPSIDG
jgi:hypothetical protein